MFWSTRNLMGLTMRAEDGEAGRCTDFLVEEKSWCIRYVVADTHKWLPGRKVLISSNALATPDPGLTNISVKLTRDQIRNGPPLDMDAPVSRGYEREYLEHFGWPFYWIRTKGREGDSPAHQGFETQQEACGEKEEVSEKSCLRSIRELTGYKIDARGEETGHLHECMVDVAGWIIRYLVVDISKWYQIKGRKILIVPECVTHIDPNEKRIDTSITGEDLKDSPEYNLETPLERNFEIVLHDYYGWPRYWENVNW